MLFLLFLFGVAVGAPTPADDHPVLMQRGGCPPFWYSYNGRCYRYVATPLSWVDAESNCLSQGGNLVSIHSPGEDDFVLHLIHNFDHSGRPTWIGLTDIHKEGNWMWSDGLRVTFFAWAHGEPNNYSGIEHCGHTNYDGDLKWNDVICGHAFPSVCATRIGC